VTIDIEQGFGLPPVAEATGPFCTADFYRVVSRHDEGEPLLVGTEEAFIPLRRVGDEILFAGDPNVTDYHTPFGDGCEALIAEVAERYAPGRFVLDSLPEEAAKPLASGLQEAGWAVQARTHEITAVLELPDTFDDYLVAIGKKERHEMRRKRRRYESMVGPLAHETHHGTGWAFEEFVRLHRMAEGEKGRFLTEERLEFFRCLAELEGWRLDLLRTPADSAAAVVFGYSDPSGYYLYNSDYDPALADASPGVVLLGRMIELAITEDAPRFDFLKGDETYKFRLGARPRPLIEIVATPGAGS
jgi:CelD/BcsL family acetyltransferase involved in cellulose biosynthesis